MRNLLLFCLFIGATHWLNGQDLLQEAIDLKPYFKFDENRMLVISADSMSDRTKTIIKNYLPTAPKISGFQIRKTFEGNPFIDMEKAPQANWSLDLNKSSSLGGVNATAPSGFSVTNLADGLARFLVKRTKQELSEAFFDKFKDEVKTDPYLGHFCPFTQAQLLLIDSEVYQFNDYLESLREGFTADMTALPGSTESFLRDPSLCAGCADSIAGKVAIDLLHVGQQMVNGEPPIDMISYLAQPGSAIQTAKPSPAEAKLYDMASGLRLLDVISQSLRNNASTDPQMPWHTGREIREAFRDSVVLRIYLGLLWQKVDGISFTDDSGTSRKSMRELMRTANTGAGLVESWRQSIQSLGELTQAMQFSLQSSSNTATTVADDFFSYSQSITDLLQAVNQTGRNMLQRKKDLIPTEYILLMRQSNSLYFNVRQRNFVGAIGNVIYCLNVLGSDKKEIATLLKYANFMAAIAEANSPDEMERAIELFALPPGSSRMKKHPGRIAVALNAYAGFAAGREYLGNDASSKQIRALTAPVGLSFSYGLGKFGSVGAFVPLIDVGAVTAYRFKDDAAENLPELTWSNILSPGLYLVYDVPGKWPFALGYGAQIGPGLRKVTEMNNVVEKSGWRQGFFATVDIPITYFYLGKGKK